MCSGLRRVDGPPCNTLRSICATSEDCGKESQRNRAELRCQTLRFPCVLSFDGRSAAAGSSPEPAAAFPVKVALLHLFGPPDAPDRQDGPHGESGKDFEPTREA